jgi:hypothetical protein
MFLATPLLTRAITWLVGLLFAFSVGVWAGWSSTSDKIEELKSDLAEQVIDAHIELAHIQTEYHANVQAVNADLDAALDRLRRVPKLAPVKDAPTECGAYEAAPNQLSEPDREFLVRLGAEADEVAYRLKALQEYVNRKD